MDFKDVRRAFKTSISRKSEATGQNSSRIKTRITAAT